MRIELEDPLFFCRAILAFNPSHSIRFSVFPDSIELDSAEPYYTLLILKTKYKIVEYAEIEVHFEAGQIQSHIHMFKEKLVISITPPSIEGTYKEPSHDHDNSNNQDLAELLQPTSISLISSSEDHQITVNIPLISPHVFSTPSDTHISSKFILPVSHLRSLFTGPTTYEVQDILTLTQKTPVHKETLEIPDLQFIKKNHTKAKVNNKWVENIIHLEKYIKLIMVTLREYSLNVNILFEDKNGMEIYTPYLTD